MKISNQESIFIVCGETSADEHMAPVLEILKKELPNVAFFGMGGGHLAEEGMELIIDSRESASVMGFTEVVGKLGVLYRAFWSLVKEVDQRRPKVAVLVDFPDFNLRMAEKLKERGVKVVYFISPQLWAWRRGRIKKMKRFVYKILPIFPFEEEFYRGEGVSAKYVGHPFIDKPLPESNKQEIFNKLGIIGSNRVVALLPGSRKAEVEKILPVLLETAKKTLESDPELVFIVPVAPNVKSLVSEITKEEKNIHLIDGQAREILRIADAAIVASGTATVEAAISQVPFCICYKVTGLTYFIGKLLIRGVKFIGMPNLIAGREVAKEFIQARCEKVGLAAELDLMLNDTKHRTDIIEGLERVRLRLETENKKSVSETVAGEIAAVFLEEQNRIEKAAA